MKALTIEWLNKCRCGNKSHTVKTARGNESALWDDDAVKCNWRVLMRGRAFADRLENYQFECEGGNLNMCSDWQEFRRCFEYLSEWAMHSQTEHPATDAFLAEIRAAARNEGINYTASRLAAAFNHGFINKSLREVFDVTRMILSAKEELANEPHPIDGLSGEYAEKSLEEWAEQIRKGGNQ